MKIEVRFCSRVGDAKKRVVQSNLGIQCVSGGNPMQRAFDFTSVRGAAAPAVWVIVAAQFRHPAGVVFDDAAAGDVIRIAQTDFSHTVRIEPFVTRLMANYPNPFNPETWIPFELSQDADVTVHIYGLDGGIVRTLDLGHHMQGEYRARESAAYWDGRNQMGERVASGVYVYELLAGDHRAVRRMVIGK